MSAANATVPSPSLDHAAFGQNRPNADKVIDSKSSERALREKPDSSFSQRALEEEARANEPSMEEILASIRRIIADDDNLPGVRREERRRLKEEEPETSSLAASAYPTPVLERIEEERLAAAAERQLMADIRRLRLAGRDLESEVEASTAAGEGAENSLNAAARAADDESDAVAVTEGPLMSAEAAASVASQFQALAASILISESGLLQKYAQEMLRPMLKSWLDDNLPAIVERLVRAEIARIARGGGR